VYNLVITLSTGSACATIPALFAAALSLATYTTVAKFNVDTYTKVLTLLRVTITGWNTDL